LVFSEVDTGEIVGHISAHGPYITALAVAPDGLTMATGAQDKTVRVWNLANLLKNVPEQPKHRLQVNAIAATQRFAVTASCDEGLRVWDWQRGRCERVLVTSHESFQHLVTMPGTHRVVHGRFKILDLG
jgi:WD40 repeat protein